MYQNYRSLADVALDLGPIDVLFGPSGAGKSSLLDTIELVHDCVDRSVEFASAKRAHGFGLLFDGAPPDGPIRLRLATEVAEYELALGLSAGRIDPFAGEQVYRPDRGTVPLERRAGTARANLLDVQSKQYTPIELREPGRLSLYRCLDPPYLVEEVIDLIGIVSTGLLYHSRSLSLSRLKWLGSSTGVESHLTEQGENLFSILRNLEGRRLLDDRYATIMRYMSEAFPTFKGLVIEPTAPTVLYASFLEHGRRVPVPTSGISDGHLQFLTLVTALFFDDRKHPRLVLFDEPEASLHPWALAVLAKAIREATASWGRQVILATQSPALINEFDRDEQLAVELQDGRTQITRVSEIEDIQDLLEDYSTGTLYMTEAVAPQSKLVELSTSSQ